jgi:hypothetical protein
MVLGAYMQPPTPAMESVRVGGLRRWHLRSRLVHDGLLAALRHSGRRLSDVRGLTICGHIEELLVRSEPEEPNSHGYPCLRKGILKSLLSAPG